MKTHMTRMEISALEEFASGKKIDTDIAIRALVTIALHGSGDLQHVAEDEVRANIADLECEQSYLLYLGQTWFGDENRFPFDTQNRPGWDGSAEGFHDYESTKAKASSDKIEKYIQSTASLLNQFSDMTAQDVQRDIGGITMEKAHFILAQATILHEVAQEEARSKERAKAAEEERWAKERKDNEERRAKEAGVVQQKLNSWWP
jgi:hypothetical protein